MDNAERGLDLLASMAPPRRDIRVRSSSAWLRVRRNGAGLWAFLSGFNNSVLVQVATCDAYAWPQRCCGCRHRIWLFDPVVRGLTIRSSRPHVVASAA